MAKDSSGTGCLILIVLVAILGLIRCTSEPDPEPAAPAVYSPAPENVTVRADAIAQFQQLPGVAHAEWVDDELWLGVADNGSSWQGVADSACAWVRQRGMAGVFKVKIVSAAALANKRADQLAYAYCN